MAANKVIRFGPVAVSNAVGNLVNPAVTSMAGPVGFTATQPYVIIKHIRIVNKTAAPVTFTGYIGATGASAAGTEFMGVAKSVPANDYIDWYGNPGVRLDAADFLTGVASALTSLTFEAEGEIGLS